MWQELSVDISSEQTLLQSNPAGIFAAIKRYQLDNASFYWRSFWDHNSTLCNPFRIYPEENYYRTIVTLPIILGQYNSSENDNAQTDLDSLTYHITHAPHSSLEVIDHDIRYSLSPRVRLWASAQEFMDYYELGDFPVTGTKITRVYLLWLSFNVLSRLKYFNYGYNQVYGSPSYATKLFPGSLIDAYFMYTKEYEANGQGTTKDAAYNDALSYFANNNVSEMSYYVNQSWNLDSRIEFGFNQNINMHTCKIRAHRFFINYDSMYSYPPFPRVKPNIFTPERKLTIYIDLFFTIHEVSYYSTSTATTQTINTIAVPENDEIPNYTSGFIMPVPIRNEQNQLISVNYIGTLYYFLKKTFFRHPEDI